MTYDSIFFSIELFNFAGFPMSVAFVNDGADNDISLKSANNV